MQGEKWKCKVEGGKMKTAKLKNSFESYWRGKASALNVQPPPHSEVRTKKT